MSEETGNSALSWRNDGIATASLPSVDGLHYEPVSVRLAWIRLGISVSLGVIAALVLLIISLLAGEGGVPRWLVPVPLGLFLLIALWSAREARWHAIALREHDISHRKGLLFRSWTTLPFARLQHVELRRGPLERACDLASLRFFTAGGLQADLVVSGLRHEQALRLREHVTAKVDAHE